MPIHTSPNYWILETRRSAYAFGLNKASLLSHCYWGKRLPFVKDYPAPFEPTHWASTDGYDHFIPEEYPGYAGVKYIDPALKVTFPDGVRDVVLTFVDFITTASPQPTLALRFKDSAYPLQVTLHYRIHEEYDLIERWVTLENLGTDAIHVERVFSAKWTMPPGDDYSLSHLYGRHVGEFQMQREALTPGLKVIESRRLIPSHRAAPWFAVDRCAGEEHGDVWFGTLAWSGNFKITAEVTEFASTRVSVGLNDWDFAWKLIPGQPFVTPSSISGYTSNGFGDASRSFHDYVRNELIPHGKVLHKILYNSWEATLFAVDETSQSNLAAIAANMGVELFVMDDGWFHNRNWDNAGLGDWFPDKVKFPNGLHNLIKNVNDLGMDFGLWVEPEMTNPDSDLYRTHPDWVIHFPTRARTESRNQLILNMARADVQEYIIGVLDALLSDHNIAFIKWDMNRGISEPGWAEAPGDQRELWVRYVQGLYHVWGALRQRHPNVIWQSCASGGGRTDLGILKFADQVWTSDNTEATARLGIQEGYSQFLPANTMEAWVTDWGKDLVPLEFRFHVSMCGSLGVGGNLLEWNQAERQVGSDCIQLYKTIRHIIQFGDQFRLVSPQRSDYSAVQYVSKDKSEAVLFAFRTHIPDPFNIPMLYLRGLDPEALYSVEGFDHPRSGLAWMESGLKVELKNLQSRVIKITRFSQS
ncbi:MAG: alpha-galactosidase [Anaerolineales bacterium]|nr:alpha-galactosidase [Anaerolineales bacterium]MBP6208521.1 alpha-galactosidase [Anaerolineales bacterium]